MKAGTRNFCLICGFGLASGMIISGCASMDPPDATSGPVIFRPTYSGDEFEPPVYTSPTVTPAKDAPPGTNATQNSRE